MERLLWLYGQPYDPLYPVICFDERPCFLIGDAVAPLAMRSGQARKEHYTYEKNGSRALPAAIEPLTAPPAGSGQATADEEGIHRVLSGAGRGLPGSEKDPARAGQPEYT